VTTIFFVAAGGAVGAVLRYLLVTASSSLGAGFPFGTLLVNVIGSFAIGALAATSIAGDSVSAQRLFFQTGLLGAFTTFSAFSLDTLSLWQNGQIAGALLNVVLNVALCLLMVSAGMLLVTALQR